jgi:hypothetical protein
MNQVLQLVLEVLELSLHPFRHPLDRDGHGHVRHVQLPFIPRSSVSITSVIDYP